MGGGLVFTFCIRDTPPRMSYRKMFTLGRPDQKNIGADFSKNSQDNHLTVIDLKTFPTIGSSSRRDPSHPSAVESLYKRFHPFLRSFLNIAIKNNNRVSVCVIDSGPSPSFRG